MDQDYPEPQIKTSTAAYTVWILPFIALLLAMWLIYKNFAESGITINITFPDATGMIVNKTAVKFRGIEVGRVRKLIALEDGTGVLATVEMNRDTEPYLTDKLRFWLVKPNVGLTGVSGLETLFSGAYIQVDGGEDVQEGNSTRFFEALVGAPQVDPAESLLVYKLVTGNASGVNAGSLIYHRNITVGAVHHVQLSDDHQSVEVTIALQPKYQGLVKNVSRFWSISGVQASFDMSGVKIQSNGFVPMLVGGIAFNSPPNAQPAEEQTVFRLYANADAARDSVEVKLTFAPDADVKTGSAIYLDQQRVGEVESLKWDPNFKSLVGKAKLSMDVAPLMRSGTQFWLDSPALAINNLKLGPLIRGTVIRLSPGEGEVASEFSVLSQSPYKKWATTGLHFHLVSKDTYGLKKGSALYYKSQPIGEIKWMDFDPEKKQFNLDALIFPRFRSMINESTLFYNVSGINFSAELDGVKMSMPSMKQLVAGGIGIYLADEGQQAPLPPESTVMLHKSLDEALASRGNNDKLFTLHSADLVAPRVGSKVLYKQFEIGKVRRVALAKGAKHSVIDIAIAPGYADLVKQDSKFWMKGAMDVKADISGVSLSVAPLMSMLTGAIELGSVTLDEAAAKPGKTFELYANEQASKGAGELIALTINRETTLKAGAPIKYRGYEVGKVESVTLMDNLSNVKAMVRFDPAYQHHFNRADARYWLVQPKVHFSGVKNIATTLLGDHLAVDKGNGNSEMQNRFVVSQANLGYQHGLSITLHAGQAGSLGSGDPILYRQLRIGEVNEVVLTADNRKVAINATIFDDYRHLITDQSRFWQAGGFKVDAGLFSGVQIQTQTLESMVAGGIAMATALHATPADAGHIFELHPDAEDGWLDGIVGNTAPE